jgi:hypothetical protein
MNDRERREVTTAELAQAGDPNVERRAADDARRFQRPAPAPEEAQKVETMDALFPQEELNQLRSRWKDLQTEFVDEPRRSVQEADALVASTIQRLAASFAEARAKLEGQWARGGDVSTEDLRVALRRYRSFFDRLLAI